MTETQERFLRTVLTRVPLASVVELHLFPPIRRGTMETGVAVIATELPPASLTTLAAHSGAGAAAATESAGDVEAVDAIDAVDAVKVVEVVEVVEAVEAIEAVDSVDVTAVAPILAPDANQSPAAHDDAPDAGDVAIENLETADTVSESVIVEALPAHAPRLRILTAAYRHTIKGMDRGKWTVDVQEEADAPLEAVEAVLRGVRHRSAEAADPELVVHDTLAALIAPVRVAPAA